MTRNMTCACPALNISITESRGRLYRVALSWCGDEMVANNLVQKVMETGAIRGQQLKDESKIISWLFRILHSAWSAHPEKNRTHVISDYDINPADTRTCDSYHEIDLATKVHLAIVSLSGDQRQVLSLVDLGELSYCEVAEVLDISIDEVMSRLHQARRLLLDKIDTAVPASIAARKNIHQHTPVIIRPS